MIGEGEEVEFFFRVLLTDSASCTEDMAVCTQPCPALCDPTDCSPPGSSVPGISQARILEWVAIPSPGDLTDLETEPQTPTLHAEDLLNQKKLKRKRSCRLDLLIREG